MGSWVNSFGAFLAAVGEEGVVDETMAQELHGIATDLKRHAVLRQGIPPIAERIAPECEVVVLCAMPRGVSQACAWPADSKAGRERCVCVRERA